MKQVQVVILAAGRGSRMGGSLHKTLVPISGDRGTLDLLCDAVIAEPAVVGVTVVAGYQYDAVRRHVLARHPDARIRRNVEFATTGMLRSLCVGTADLAPANLVVLLGDSFYSPEYLSALFDWDASCSGVAVHRPDRPAGAAVTTAEVPVAVRDGWVTGIGPAFPRDVELASAVFWIPDDWQVFRRADEAGVDSQWRALSGGVSPGGVLHRRLRAWEVPPGSFFDIDDDADAEIARGRLRDA